ncbi:hypothetical protein [Prosthecobacter fusiformis]|nr:hypothetical protein [Prosthecobacter fusiformis]
MNTSRLLCLTTFIFSSLLAAEQPIGFPKEKPLVYIAVPDDWLSAEEKGSLFVVPPVENDPTAVEFSHLKATKDNPAAALAEAKAWAQEDFKLTSFEEGDWRNINGLDVNLSRCIGESKEGESLLFLILIRHPKAETHLLLSLISSPEKIELHEKIIHRIFASVGDEPPALPAHVIASENEKAAFTFNEVSFFLRFTHQGMHEYLPAGEIVEDWKTLFSIQKVEGFDDPLALANKIIENTQATNPKSKAKVITDEDTGIYITDHLLPSPEGTTPPFVEWALMRIQKNANGLLCLQYSRRYSDYATAEAAIDNEQKKILSLLTEFSPPSLTQTYCYPNDKDPVFTINFPAGWSLQTIEHGAFSESPDRIAAFDALLNDQADFATATEDYKAKLSRNYDSIEWAPAPSQRTNEALGVTSTHHQAIAMKGALEISISFVTYVRKDGDKFLILTSQRTQEGLEIHGDTIDQTFRSIRVK